MLYSCTCVPLSLRQLCCRVQAEITLKPLTTTESGNSEARYSAFDSGYWLTLLLLLTSTRILPWGHKRQRHTPSVVNKLFLANLGCQLQYKYSITITSLGYLEITSTSLRSVLVASVRSVHPYCHFTSIEVIQCSTKHIMDVKNWCTGIAGLIIIKFDHILCN